MPMDTYPKAYLCSVSLISHLQTRLALPAVDELFVRHVGAIRNVGLNKKVCIEILYVVFTCQ